MFHRIFIEMPSFKPHLTLLNQNLHFNEPQVICIFRSLKRLWNSNFYHLCHWTSSSLYHLSSKVNPISSSPGCFQGIPIASFSCFCDSMTSGYISIYFFFVWPYTVIFLRAERLCPFICGQIIISTQIFM